MGWERRGNQAYYYQARREGGRVVKEYVPPLVAAAAAAIDQDRREMRAADAKARKAARAALDALAAELDPLCDLAAGYRRHRRGEWRKRRARSADPDPITPDADTGRADVRRLAGPAVQVNIARKQVNAAGCPSN